MKIDIIRVGELETNCYLLYNDKKCLIIDPGSEENLIIARILEQELEPLAILITHHHSDHDSGVKNLAALYKIPCYDFNNLFEKEISIGPFKFSVIYNPGHTHDSISFYFKEDGLLFCGDFIFYESIGRTDLEGGNYQEMLSSIDKIKQLPDFVKIYPGHGKPTTLEHEKKCNLYFDF